MKMYRILLGILLGLYGVACVLNILGHPDTCQKDFRVYYYSAKAHLVGLNPYDTAAVAKMAEIPELMPYLYSPATISVFYLFAKMPFPTAYRVFFLVKCLFLAGLILLWRNVFLDKQLDLVFFVIALLAFNSTVYLDLRAGNISIPEQFFIWLAFFFYLREELLAFCGLIVGVALLKVQPILLLLMLMLTGDRKKYVYLAGSILAFAVILLIACTADPYIFFNFLANKRVINMEKGIMAPSLFCFIEEVLGIFPKALPAGVLRPVSIVCFIAALAGILYRSWQAYTRTSAFPPEERKKWVVFLGCLLYSFLCVRFKDYSYILLIVPTYFIISRVKTRRELVLPLLVFLACLSGAHITLPGLLPLACIFWSYYPLLTALFVWGLYLHEINVFPA